jgi:DNA modification methylase
MKKTKLMLGDNMESLKKLPDNSVDSIVTDPPYGLSFMGKKWDYDVPSVEFWKEVYRVLKPGGHVLSFGGTRTYHRMVVNIEDAGFEIRDQIMWLYASGFPKSLNIQKQFDKNKYKVCECSEQNTEHDLRQVPKANISQTINLKNEQGKALLSQLPKQDIQSVQQVACDEGREQSSVEGWSNTIQKEGQLQGNNIQESAGTTKTDGEKGWLHNGTQVDNGSISKPTIDEDGSSPSHRPQPEQQSSKQSGIMADKRRPQESGSRKICGRCGEQVVNVKGFGTSLKPANEPICVARKPLSEKSVAENVLKWGTGGINVDGCRVGSEVRTTPVGSDDDRDDKTLFGLNKTTHHERVETTEGRFPANIILDEIAGELLDEQSGINSSRFFYQAKVSKQERNMGLDGFDEVKIKTNISGLDDKPREDGSIRETPSKKNTHPTVKPVALMAYLCRLVTPSNGIVLDPFMGSGSTGIAARLEGFKFCGMEMDEDYFKIAQARIENFEEYRKFIK